MFLIYLSGLNADGSGQRSGEWCMGIMGTRITLPFGNTCPLIFIVFNVSREVLKHTMMEFSVSLAAISYKGDGGYILRTSCITMSR